MNIASIDSSRKTATQKNCGGWELVGTDHGNREIRKGRGKKKECMLWNRMLSTVGAVLCIILFPILIINCTLIVKSMAISEEMPSVGGICPLIVMTDSMYPEIQSGDLILCSRVDAEDVEIGDIITFFDPSGDGTTVVTHRVTQIAKPGGVITFRTKGDANNVVDMAAVTEDDLVGVYRFRIPGAGNAALFMQTTTGLLLCVVCPILILVMYDVVRRSLYEHRHRNDAKVLMAELEALRAKKRKEGRK